MVREDLATTASCPEQYDSCFWMNFDVLTDCWIFISVVKLARDINSYRRRLLLSDSTHEVSLRLLMMRHFNFALTHDAVQLRRRRYRRHLRG